MRPIHFALGLLASCGLNTLAHASNPPANVCVELVAWLDQREAQAAQKPAGQAQAAQPGVQQPQAPGQAGQPQQGANHPSGQQQAGAGQDAAPRRDLNTAVEQARPGEPQRPGGQDEAQKTSGMSSAVTYRGPGAAGPQGDAQERAQSGAANPKADGPNQQKPGEQQQASAPAKPPEPQSPPPNPQAVEKARAAAQAQDVQACRAVTREMRLAGVALPNPLIALAALRPDYVPGGQQGQQAVGQQPGASGQPGPAPGLPPIPPSGIPPARDSGSAPR